MKKGCELCGKAARMYCDSDDAILCWECDERVHSANFLVAKHSRSLLCHVCQSLTPWKASGTKLGPTLSVCDSCSNHYQHAAAGGGGGEEEEIESVTGEDSDDDETEIDSESDDEEEEDDGENQVVPWSPGTGIIRASSSSPPPPLTTSSCSEEGSPSTRDDGGDLAVSSADLKRFRHNPQLDSDDEDGCCSSKNVVMEENGGDSLRALKMARTEEFSIVETESRRRMEITSSLMRFKQRMVCDEHNPSQIIRGISKLSREDT